MGVSADLKRRGERNPPSTETSHIRGWRWHRQECQLVWFVGCHGGEGVGGEGCGVTRDIVSQAVLSISRSVRRTVRMT